MLRTLSNMLFLDCFAVQAIGEQGNFISSNKLRYFRSSYVCIANASSLDCFCSLPLFCILMVSSYSLVLFSHNYFHCSFSCIPFCIQVAYFELGSLKALLFPHKICALSCIVMTCWTLTLGLDTFFSVIHSSILLRPGVSPVQDLGNMRFPDWCCLQ